MTKQEQYIKALTAYGWLRSDTQPRLGGTKTYSRKYVRMHEPSTGEVLWIGRAGAVRRGKTVTGSYAMGEAWKARLVSGKLVGTFGPTKEEVVEGVKAILEMAANPPRVIKCDPN